MKKITTLDSILLELNRQTCQGDLTTIEDLSKSLHFDKSTILKALDYLTTLKYCEKINNGFQITFEGEYFIDKNRFLTISKPFSFEYFYKSLKILALIANTLLVLTLGWLNYANNRLKNSGKNIRLQELDSQIKSVPKITEIKSK